MLIGGGLLLALWGMGYGFFYAVAVEHQTLDAMGHALASVFLLAANRDITGSTAALQSFTKANFVYVRQVDAHSHWIGLSMLLLLFGMVFDRVNFGRALQLWLAAGMIIGAFVFPCGVLLETFNPGALPKVVAAAGAAIMIAALSGTALGCARKGASS